MSWHFVPANVSKLVSKSLSGAAHAVILDLEDSVALAEKDAARRTLAELRTLPDKQIWVRTNAVETDEFERDFAAARANPAIAGILLPKIEKASQLPSGASLQRDGGDALHIGLLIESALGVLNLHTVLAASESIAMVMFGGAEQGDLMGDLRCSWSPSGLEMIHARQHVLLCARAHQVQPVDGVYARLSDLAGLEEETRVSKSFGFRARASVHPAQLEVIHRCYAPTADEEHQAKKLVQAFESSLIQGKAAVQIEGRLVDYAMYRAAKRVLNV